MAKRSKAQRGRKAKPEKDDHFVVNDVCIKCEAITFLNELSADFYQRAMSKGDELYGDIEDIDQFVKLMNTDLLFTRQLSVSAVQTKAKGDNVKLATPDGKHSKVLQFPFKTTQFAKALRHLDMKILESTDDELTLWSLLLGVTRAIEISEEELGVAYDEILNLELQRDGVTNERSRFSKSA